MQCMCNTSVPGSGGSYKLSGKKDYVVNYLRVRITKNNIWFVMVNIYLLYCLTGNKNDFCMGFTCQFAKEISSLYICNYDLNV